MRTALIVREDDLSLYGFADADERAVFDLLLRRHRRRSEVRDGSARRDGPGDIAAAVAAEDDASFRKVSGIGPKTAKLIVLSLSGKMRASPCVRPAGPRPAASVTASWRRSIGLGWSERVAAEAIDDAMAAAVR